MENNETNAIRDANNRQLNYNSDEMFLIKAEGGGIPLRKELLHLKVALMILAKKRSKKICNVYKKSWHSTQQP